MSEGRRSSSRLRWFQLSLLLLGVLLGPVPIVVQGEGDEFRPKPVQVGPWVNKTDGEVWPKPRYQIKQGDFFILDPAVFEFKVGTQLTSCTINYFSVFPLPPPLGAMVLFIVRHTLHLTAAVTSSRNVYHHIEFIITSSHLCILGPADSRLSLFY